MKQCASIRSGWLSLFMFKVVASNWQIRCTYYVMAQFNNFAAYGNLTKQVSSFNGKMKLNHCISKEDWERRRRTGSTSKIIPYAAEKYSGVGRQRKEKECYFMLIASLLLRQEQQIDSMLSCQITFIAGRKGLRKCALHHQVRLS